MRYTKQRNTPRSRGRVEVTAEGMIVVFGSGRSVSMDVGVANILSLERGGSTQSEGFAIQRRERPVVAGSANDSEIYIYDRKAGKEQSDLMIISRRGLQRAARLVAQEQA